MAPAGFDKTSDVPSAKRKLAAILHADVVGYSRMMGEDEAGTHARLMSFRRIFEQAIVRHDGRIVGTAGDAILADFPSVVEALSVADGDAHPPRSPGGPPTNGPPTRPPRPAR